MENSLSTLVSPPQPAEFLGLDPTKHAHYLALMLLGVPATHLPTPIRGKEYNFDDFKGADRTLAIALALNAQTDLLYVQSTEMCYRPISPHLYEPLEDFKIKRMVKALWMRNLTLLGSLDSKKIKECVEMVKECTKEYQEDLSRRYISVTPTLFWDTETASLTPAPEQPVFFKLFDTPSPNNHFIKIPPFTEQQIRALQDSYQRSLEYLNAHDGDLPEDYEFVTLWADHNHDVYMDIMRMFASPFMRRKPFGSFMAIGLKRNGKTAATGDFMKTLMGTANCSSIQLAQLGDHHQNAALQWTLWNAPDEEDEKPTPYATIFKTIADHGEIKVTKLYSQIPISINCDFMCAYPMNHHPVWTGSGAAACVARSLIIEFTHRFDEDTNPRTFAERTFTADLFASILGPILALATYYLDRPMTFSETMRRQQYALEGEMDSHTTYLDHFIAFFDGFQSVKMLYEDYKLWCAAHDVPISPLPAFKLAFGAFTAGGQKGVKFDGKKVKGYRVRQPGKKPLFPDQVYTIVGGRQVGPLSLYQDPREPLHYSIVERCEAILEEKFGEQAEEQLNKMIVAAQATMREKQEELPPEPEQQPLVDDILK